jgi:hypothetical protein
MWKTNADGKAMNPDDDPDPVPFKPLQGNVLINSLKANQKRN